MNILAQASMFRFLSLWCLILLGVAIVGCGPSGPVTVPISGTVTLDGKPLSDASIRFVPDNIKLPPEGGEIVEGKFTMRAKPGKNRVEILATRPPRGSNPAPDAPHVGWEQYLPPRYNYQTELQAEVADSGNNEFRFNLKSSK